MKSLSISRFLGIALIVLAIGTAVIPQFTTCQSQGKAIQLANGKTTPMKCYWTGQAEIATAVPIFAVGSLMIASRRKEDIRNLGMLGIVLGAFAIALPTKIIGTCSTTMICHTVMKPSLVALGSLTVAASAVGTVISFRKTSSAS
jgi:hypothetical protein